jgi:hypothetical protein
MALFIIVTLNCIIFLHIAVLLGDGKAGQGMLQGRAVGGNVPVQAPMIQYAIFL